MGSEAPRPASRTTALLVVVVTGVGLLAAAAVGLPWRWAVVLLFCGVTALASTTMRHGAGAVAVPVLGVLGLSACAVVPGGHLNPLWALAVAVATVAYLTALEIHTTGVGSSAVRGEALGAVAIAAGSAALLALPAVSAPWLLPLGLAASVLAFATALAGTGGRCGRRRP